MGVARADQDCRLAILAVEYPGQFDPSRPDRRDRLLRQWRRGLCPCRTHRNTAQPPRPTSGMRRSGAVPCLRRVELYQRRRDRYRWRLYRRRPRPSAQPRARRIHQAAKLMGRLADKVALITGAAAGQGAAYAEQCLREGAAVMLTDIDAPAGAALAQRLTDKGGKAVFRAHDVVDESGWREVIAATVSELGGLHILVNNAGITVREGILDATVAGWDRVMAVNLTGPLLGMKHCAPTIRD